MAIPIILGIDPGTTTAGAILSLDGEKLSVFSGKNFTLGDFIKQALAFGQPVLASTDKEKIPSFVQEFAAQFRIPVVAPEKDFKREEKNQMLKEHFNSEPLNHNDHELDALASAILAYRKYWPKLHKIQRFLAENNLFSIKDEFTRLALQEEDLNFTTLREILTRPQEEQKIMQRVIVENKTTRKDFLLLYKKLESSKYEKRILEQKIDKLNQELKQFKRNTSFLEKKKLNFNQRVDTLLSFKEQRLGLQGQKITELENRNKNLVKKIEELFSFIGTASNFQLLKKLDRLSQEEYDKNKDFLELKENDLILIREVNSYSDKILKQITDKNLVLCSFQPFNRAIREKAITILLSPAEIIKENEYFALVDEEMIKRKLSSGIPLAKLVEDYQKIRKTETR